MQLKPNESHNLLAIILTFDDPHYGVKYSVKNITSGLIWSDTLFNHGDLSLIEIVPSSILSIRDGDKFEITADKFMSCGIHLLYKTDITMISNPFLSYLESKMSSLSVGGNSKNIKGRRWRRRRR